MFEGAHQYAITQPKMLKTEWKVNKPEESESHSTQLNIFTPSVLTDANEMMIGKVYAKKLLTFKREISVDTKDCKIEATWTSVLRTFPLTGESDIEGYEKINWKWKREGMNSKLTLEDCENGQCLAEFRRKHPSYHELGDLCIYPELHPDLNWFIVLPGCYSLRHMLIEERSHGIWV